MSQVAKAFEVLKSAGFFKGMYNVSCVRNADKKCWEITGHFQTQVCRQHYMIAEFGTADETVEFKRLCQQLTGSW